MAGHPLPLEGLVELRRRVDHAIGAPERRPAVGAVGHEAPLAALAHLHLVHNGGHLARSPPLRHKLRVGVDLPYHFPGRVEDPRHAKRQRLAV